MQNRNRRFGWNVLAFEPDADAGEGVGDADDEERRQAVANPDRLVPQRKHEQQQADENQRRRKHEHEVFADERENHVLPNILLRFRGRARLTGFAQADRLQRDFLLRLLRRRFRLIRQLDAQRIIR